MAPAADLPATTRADVIAPSPHLPRTCQRTEAADDAPDFNAAFDQRPTPSASAGRDIVPALRDAQAWPFATSA
jgi:hypothetical protein